MTNCPKCGGKLYHNQGISRKTGEPYENYKCSSCNYIEWVDSPRKRLPDDGKFNGEGRLSDEERAAGQAKGAAFKGAIDVTIAMLNKYNFSKEDFWAEFDYNFAEAKKRNLE